MSRNSDLGAAKNAKKDEFYTQLSDIEKEMRYYRKHFKGKTVFCNCDDPFESNFFKYFVLNFNRLGLKKLIATCYATSPIMGGQLKYLIDSTGQMRFSFDDEPVAEESSTDAFASAAFGLLICLSRLISDDYDKSQRRLSSQVDHKLRKAISRKKQEMGIKSDYAQSF